MTTTRRHNGFSRPYTMPQIGAWIALFGTAVHIALVVAAVLPLVVSVPVTAFLGLLIVGVLYLGGKTQATDPIDPRLLAVLKSRGDAYAQQGLSSSSFNPPTTGETKQCWICDCQVGVNSMHCKFCNKCVDVFDHHCLWLNTCCGKANYRPFVRTMYTIFVLEVSHAAVCIALVVEYFGFDTARLDNWFLGSGVTASAITIFFAIFASVSVLMIGQLLWFHIGLQREGITTYQYIVRDHKKRRDEQRQLEELQGQRALRIVEATQHGRSYEAWRLRCGGNCRTGLNCPACDPMDLPESAEPNPEEGFAAVLGGNRNGASGNGGPNDFSTAGAVALTEGVDEDTAEPNSQGATPSAKTTSKNR